MASQVNPRYTELVDSVREKSHSIYNNSDPHNPHVYLDRGKVYAQLGFYDLAAADAYRALTLLEGVVDPDCAEYVARRRLSSSRQSKRETADGLEPNDNDEDVDDDDDDLVDISRNEYDETIADVYFLLVQSLTRCGCLRDAHDFLTRAVEHLQSLDKETSSQRYDQVISRLDGEVVNEIKQHQRKAVGKDKEEKDLDPASLPGQGYARRILYPWNQHEPDRNAPETLSLLNKRLESVAPDCEVRAVSLPVLHEPKNSAQEENNERANETSIIQLGLFAKRDLLPGETILRESSLLTATNRLHDDLCDACNGPLPELQTGSESAEQAAVACQECDDTIFCSQACHDQAQAVYHSAICGQEGLQSLGKDVADPKDKADYLYFLLLGRALAMAATQDLHPLDLPEVKYIWGDFHEYNPDDSNEQAKDPSVSSSSSSLPFSFQLNILQPMRFVEEMGLDPFTTLDRYDTWILNTLYAKFRGTASGRLSTWDGGPEVCAVHPLWCLANHSCDPNVRWEWGGEITFMVRRDEEKAVWRRTRNHSSDDGDDDGTRHPSPAIIRKDEEILNHYCDIALDVRQRREWAQGALGGLCQCARCKWEAS
ncbi:hypothetical protein BGW36DRAFT_425474 [Talaromyces proteolyticus]|uniref:SET domain-containing protein n=1 Tax=Talaromyces proteolyticus TaxID=1131652 RepID=A0AAD4KZ07_9EURO|nr:uncharacterized protein BGW36DRAFT_425474 [Talaromyces proteolyticus]KAH8700661.1 hypothetical protein BGW36DRAFT_425474 [Talaromyces proteolyticus]